MGDHPATGAATASAIVSADSPPGSQTAELTIVIPTFNERTNIHPLLRLVDQALPGVHWEMIIVDDNSPDGTSAAVKQIAAVDARVRCIRRIARRGLAGACLEGILASAAPFVAVMDADLQHDEALLVPMLDVLRRKGADLVVATRYAEGGAENVMTRWRAAGSRLAAGLVHRWFDLRLSDPMSGFFMARRDFIETLAPRLSTQGFKILLDIAVTAGRNVRIAEIPFAFRPRHSGMSKLDAGILLDYLGLIVAKATHDRIPIQFVLFSLVGMSGIGVHLLLLALGLYHLDLDFATAQILATAVAIASNFVINNVLTYRDRRLAGARFFGGLLLFYVISSIGLISNVSVSNWLFVNEQRWWIAGFAGALISLVWNYAVASLFVWHAR